VYTFGSPAEVLEAVGRTYGPGPWVEVSQERVDAFTDATGDHQSVHVGFATAQPYLTLSMLPFLSLDVLAYDGCSARMNYGVEQVRFPRAPLVGSRVRACAEVVAASRTAAGVRITLRWRVEIEGDATPACVADTVAVLVP